jgi:hypothetical protein
VLSGVSEPGVTAKLFNAGWTKLSAGMFVASWSIIESPLKK